ncbi:MAG: hypothetical protein ACFBZ8_07920 [Opitutales bacterium]
MKLLKNICLISVLGLSTAFFAGCPQDSEEAGADVRSENEELLSKLESEAPKAHEKLESAIASLESKDYATAIKSAQEAVKEAPEAMKSDIAAAQLDVQTKAIGASFEGAGDDVKSVVDKVVSALKEGNTEAAMAEVANLQKIADQLTDEQKAVLSSLAGDAGKMIKDAADKIGL